MSNNDENNPFVAFRKVIDEQVAAATRVLLTELPSQLTTAREDLLKNVEAADRTIERAFRRLGDAYERSTNPERTQIVRREEPKNSVTQAAEQSQEDGDNSNKTKRWNTTSLPPFHPLDIIAHLLDYPPSGTSGAVHDNTDSAWPDFNHFVSSQYSPLRLEEQSKYTGNVPIKEWRDAFEDLLLASKGQPLTERPITPWWKRRHQSPADWLEDLQDRKLISTSISPMWVQRLLGFQIPDVGYVAQPDFGSLSEMLRLMDVDWTSNDGVTKQTNTAKQELPETTLAAKVSKAPTSQMNPQLETEEEADRSSPHLLRPHPKPHDNSTTRTDADEVHDELRRWLDFTPSYHVAHVTKPTTPVSPEESKTISTTLKHYHQINSQDSNESETTNSIKTEEITITPDGTKTTKTVWKVIGEDGETHVTKREERVEYMSRRKTGVESRPLRSVEPEANDDANEDFEVLRRSSPFMTKSAITKNEVERAAGERAKLREVPEKKLNEVKRPEKKDDPELEQKRDIGESKTKSWFWDW